MVKIFGSDPNVDGSNPSSGAITKAVRTEIVYKSFVLMRMLPLKVGII